MCTRGFMIVLLRSCKWQRTGMKNVHNKSSKRQAVRMARAWRCKTAAAHHHQNKRAHFWTAVIKWNLIVDYSVRNSLWSTEQGNCKSYLIWMEFSCVCFASHHANLNGFLHSSNVLISFIELLWRSPAFVYKILWPRCIGPFWSNLFGHISLE